jgi:transcriptional regulator GlxA family with amidase domain
MIKDKSEKAEYVLTVCTGSALLAKTGLLYNRNATSNRIAFDWVKQQGAGVIWQDRARWEKDGKFYTSAGVTAGIDMILGFISDTLSPDAAQKVAEGMEYIRAY